MKFNWALLVREMRVTMLDVVTIEGVDKEHTADLMGYLRTMMLETDRFHPIDYDYDLERVFRRLPERCNYRNIKSYWAWKHGRGEAADEVCTYLLEMGSLIEEHFSNKWNFGPGYIPPKAVNADFVDSYVEKILPRIIRKIKDTHA